MEIVYVATVCMDINDTRPEYFTLSKGFVKREDLIKDLVRYDGEGFLEDVNMHELRDTLEYSNYWDDESASVEISEVKVDF